MLRFVFVGLLLSGTLLLGEDQPTVFKSDVAMTRVDAQVLDRDGRAITGLQINDFKLTLNGHVLPVKSLASENMPIDILLLLDVSGSMEPHVQRLASAAHQALNVLAAKDRVAVMVFDTNTRLRLPFSSDHDEITQELNHVLRSERFNRGTQITSALISAASYMQRQARPEARRAIVIMTDDETQDDEDVPRVDSALARANAVLSFLQAPYEPPTMMTRRRGGTWGGGGGGGGGGLGWPGGGGIGFPGGGGGSWPGGGGMGRRGGMDPSHSAGTADIARDSGGDTFNVEQASALEDTLARLRQRYALYFNYPEGADSTTPENVKVDLSNEAKIRYADAEIHYRHVYMASNGANNSGATSVTRTHVPDADTDSSSSSSRDPDVPSSTQTHRRRPAVSDDSGSSVNTVTPDADSSSGSSSANGSGTSAPSQQPATRPAPSQGGWPSANPDSSSSPR